MNGTTCTYIYRAFCAGVVICAILRGGDVRIILAQYRFDGGRVYCAVSTGHYLFHIVLLNFLAILFSLGFCARGQPSDGRAIWPPAYGLSPHRKPKNQFSPPPRLRPVRWAMPPLMALILMSP